MVLLIILPLLLLALLLFVLYYGNKRRVKNEDEEQTNRSLRALERSIKDGIYRSMSSVIIDAGLDMEHTAEIIRDRTAQRINVQNACSGDPGARKSTKLIVGKALGDELEKRNKNIDYYITFNKDQNVLPRTAFETLLYTMSTHYISKKNGVVSDEMLSKTDAFENMMKKYSAEFDGLDIITEDTILNIYDKENPDLSEEDKRAIAEQIIFSDLFGLKIIDSLNYQTVGVEEIQIGTNGLAKKLYDSDEEIRGISKKTMSAKDSIYVQYRGRLKWLKFLSFSNDAEMVSCLNNLIANCNAGELTEANPHILTKTPDGRRIAEAMPPFSDAYVGFIRKFNSLQVVNLEKLYSRPADKVLVETIEAIAMSCCNICISGIMNAGKTTAARCLIQKTANFPMGTIEVDSYEINVRQYFPERNVAAFLVYDNVDEDAALAFARKTTRPVWVVGEITSPKTANMAIDLNQICEQLIFTCHNSTTPELVNTFQTGKLNFGGFKNEVLAQREAVAALCFDIQVVNKHGDRHIKYIHQIIPIAPEHFEDSGYYVASIMEYDEETKDYKAICKPSHDVFKKAKEKLTKEEYERFESIFNRHFENKPYADDVAADPTLLFTAEDERDEFRSASWYIPQEEVEIQDDEF